MSNHKPAPTEELKEKADSLPISTSVGVLGARISVAQRANYVEMQGGKHPGGLRGVKIHAADGDPYLDMRSRGYIAAWARRNLFNGAGPR